MSITVSLNHKTKYYYDEPTVMSPQVIRLRPAPHTRTPIQSYSLDIEPADHFINWQQDPFGNHLARIVFPEPVNSFEVNVNLVAELVAVNPFDFFLEPEAEEVPFVYSETLKRELSPYMQSAEIWSGELEDWQRSCIPNGERTVDYLISVTQQLSKLIDYEIRYEPGVQSSQTTLSKSSGSCRDSAWFLVETLRHLGFAARFVSGYLVQLVPDVKPVTGPAGPKQDFTDLHAWTEVYLPGAGWVGFDPTSGLAAGEGHIPLVATPEPQSAAPITGSTSSEATNFEYSNTVTRIEDAPRSTRPYRDKQWDQIIKLGDVVDDSLLEQGIKLTTGGEPTFVSATDLESEQWNTEADGKDKRIKANKLARSLLSEFSTGGIIQYTQGKWYPGEPLPRWEMALSWRKDGLSLWNDPSLLADPQVNLGHDNSTCRRFTENLASELKVDNQMIKTCYEDPLYGLWREASMPVDIDPAKEDLSNSSLRKSMVDDLESDLSEPAGYAINIDRQDSGTKWLTSTWPVKRSQVFLIPGSSPMGMRLPLDTLPKSKKVKLEETPERDPGEIVPTLEEAKISEGSIASDPIIVRKAVCCEVRDGVTHVFLPPLTRIEYVIDLLGAIERTARRSNIAVVLEGYSIVNDVRIEKLSVTPDPGVIEVNIHPTSSFRELNKLSKTLYDIASSIGLATEKFHLDGRHTGTGGGNHITIGGPTPQESPLLNDPTLLCGIIRYWQNHPSLSYLFSGLFVGPTSQAPRVDEARLESLHELEIALGEVERSKNPSPWLADRALRHILTDLTGNTHRAELCIDKLYSPEHARGRLGLLELRAFEMPPHFQMSMVSYLLVRAIVARISKESYKQPLVRWGTDLHDRFLLPHYLGEDISMVCEDLANHGFRFDPTWFEPFFAFRFPRFGTILSGDVSMELRAAIEPWLVLGEEIEESGTSRYVDSSMERLQVKTSGLIEERHSILVNGHALPLRSTGRPGEFVAGVKYRAWHPPSALHPTIGVHTPLSFEIVDRWNDKVVGGAKYHVSHPGGRNYEVLPVNSLEAESRRQSRFDESTLVQQGSLSQESIIEKEYALNLPVIREQVDKSGPRVEPIVSNYSPTIVSDAEIDHDFPTTLDLRNRPNNQ